MGANTFFTVSSGASAKEAFSAAVSNAQYQSGHGGYSGTIAEKHNFVMVADTTEALMPRIASTENISDEGKAWLMSEMSKSASPADKARCIGAALIELNDRRISDKWGPAGCVEIEPGKKYLFFGWASS